MNILENLPNMRGFIALDRVGSRVTCNPAPTNTDQDYLLFVLPHTYGQFKNAILENGYEDCRIAAQKNTSKPWYERLTVTQSQTYNFELGLFEAFRKGEDNIILTKDIGYYTKFMDATKLAKQFNLLKKADRVALFNYIIEEELPNQATIKSQDDLFSFEVGSEDDLFKGM